MHSSFDKMLLHRWREVIDKHKDKLTDEDLDTVERLGSPEAILAYLQERQADLNNKCPASLFGQLYSFLKCLQSFSFMFTISMFSHSIETSIAWGFLAILLQVRFYVLNTRNNHPIVFRSTTSDDIKARPAERRKITEYNGDTQLDSTSFDKSQSVCGK